MNVRHPWGVVHSFPIKNIFFDKMDLRLFYFQVTIWRLIFWKTRSIKTRRVRFKSTSLRRREGGGLRKKSDKKRQEDRGTRATVLVSKMMSLMQIFLMLILSTCSFFFLQSLMGYDVTPKNKNIQGACRCIRETAWPI